MDVPKSVSVLGLKFTVELVERVSESEELDGIMLPREQRIRIDRSLSREAAEQTYLHELVHAVLSQLGFHEQGADERLVQGLALGLHEALR